MSVKTDRQDIEEMAVFLMRDRGLLEEGEMLLALLKRAEDAEANNALILAGSRDNKDWFDSLKVEYDELRTKLADAEAAREAMRRACQLAYSLLDDGHSPTPGEKRQIRSAIDALLHDKGEGR